MNGQRLRTLRVGLDGKAYDIRIGAGLIGRAAAHLAPVLVRPRVAIITDATVARLHLDPLRAGLAAEGIAAPALTLAPGEATKGWAGLQRVTDWLLDEHVERDDLVLALGGGVVGDLAGFAAAILRRGVGYVQMPTTLLAQVDSAVGGKTGINAAAGKNLIGAFHQPRLVLADIDALASLPTRDFLAGYGEVVKYGLLGDADFFAWLEVQGPALARGDAALRAEAVARCCAMKADIVARDETEQGERALLNLGHTFGHALEAATGYSDRLLHGEAVAIGCVLALALSERLGHCPPGARARLEAHLAAMGMKRGLADIPGPLPDAESLLTLMAQDKKVKGGRIAFVLVRGIGQAFLSREVEPAVVRALLAEALTARGSVAQGGVGAKVSDATTGR